MSRFHMLSRRIFLCELGKGALAAAILGAGVACGGSDDPPAQTRDTDGTERTGAEQPDSAGELTWKRAALGPVSAYVLVRGREAAIVDTGLEVAADGAEVFGLQIVSTPGHTPGHICVLDADTGVLVTGDAISNRPEGVAGPNPQYSEDMSVAGTSVKKLAGLAFETILFGHGDPIEAGAKRALETLAATLS